MSNHKIASIRSNEEHLDHAERLQAMGALAGGIAHEFNNILGAILGYAEMAHAASGQSVAVQRHIEHIIDASHHARLVIEQVLAMSRKQERLIHPIDLGVVVEEGRPLLRIAISESAALNVRRQNEASVIDGNPIEIQQILLNLCKNAADALGGRPGQIDIDVAQTTLEQAKVLHTGEVPAGQYVTLSVCDNGSGISDDVLPHIFEVFFTTKRKAGGTGLGLAAVLDRVNALGGFIDVTSRQNQGTRFDIYLPRSREEAVDLSIFYPSKKAPLGKGEVIAILETDRTVLETYEDKVAALGYAPLGFQSFEAFKTWMANNQPDLIMVRAQSLQACQDILSLHQVIAPMPLVVIGGCKEASLADHSAPVSILDAAFSKDDLAHTLRTQIN